MAKDDKQIWPKKPRSKVALRPLPELSFLINHSPTPESRVRVYRSERRCARSEPVGLPRLGVRQILPNLTEILPGEAKQVAHVRQQFA